MSFRFEWPEFNSGFYDQAKELLRSVSLLLTFSLNSTHPSTLLISLNHVLLPSSWVGFFFLTQALNKGDKPQIIADRIDVNHLDMGSIVCQSSTLI